MRNAIGITALLLGLTLSAPIHAQDEGAPESGVFVQHPSASPSGASIVFSANFDGNVNLWLVDISGRNLRKLTYNANSDTEPTWSPDGKTIAFSRQTTSGLSDIWTIEADGSNLKQLTSNALSNHEPAWFPNGSQLAFVSDRGGTNDVWVMAADGTQVRRLTTYAGQENHPSVSPSGLQIVFSETLSGNVANLMTIHSDGSGLAPLTSGSFADWNPTWTNTGIIFSSNRGDATDHWKIWKVQADGSSLQQIGDVAALDPAVLPNGEIVFSDEFGSLSTETALSEVTLYNPATARKQTLTSVKGPLPAGDVNGDGAVNCLDLEAVLADFGKRQGVRGFNPAADVNHDGVVDLKDLVFVFEHLDIDPWGGKVKCDCVKGILR